MDYYYDIGVQILFLIMLATSLNLLLGYAGQLSMAQAAFYGIGAYTAGRLSLPVAEAVVGYVPSSGVTGGAGWPIWPAILAGVVVAFVIAALLSLPAISRVTGELLILLTLAFQLVAQQLMTTLEGVTGGTYGLTPIPPLTIFGQEFATPDKVFLLVGVIAVIVLVIMYSLGESPFGRLLKGIREHESAVQAIGKSTVRPKVVVFGVAAAVAGLAGGLNGAYYQFIAPGTYDLDLSILVIAIIVLGGAGNMTGAVIGAILIGSLKPILHGVVGDNAILWQGIVYGAALVVIMRVRPQGLLPEGTGLKSIVRLFRPAQLEPVPAGVGAGTIASGSSPPDAPAGHVGAPSGSAAEPSKRAEPVLVVKDLSKAFRGIQAVKDVDFELKERLITALVGPNGAGKTTIFNLITNTIQPDTGTVELLGQDVTGKNPNRIARAGMARSFQDTRLFLQLSALDNVVISVPGQTGEAVAGLSLRPLRARRDEMRAREKAREFLGFVGFNPPPETITGLLSYGDQKLVAIARLLATECEVLLLDEPTSGVDPSGVETVIETVSGLRDAGKTICLVEHSVHVVGKLADHAIFLNQGEVVEEGTIDELMASEHLTDIYFGG